MPLTWTSHRRRASLGTDLWLAAFALVTAALWALGALGDRYDADPPLAFADGFPGDPAAWLRHGEAGNIVVEASGVELSSAVPGESYARRAVELPEANDARGGRLLRARATVETLERAEAGAPGRGPLVMVWIVNDETGRKPVEYRTVTEVPVGAGIHRGERVIALPAGADSVWLTFRGGESGGRHRLTRASVQLVRPNRARLGALAAAALAGAVLAALGFAWVLRRGGRRTSVAVALVAGGTLVGVLVPESISTAVLGHRLDDVAFTLPALGPVEFRDLYKLGHFAFFFAGGLVAFAARRRLRLTRTQLALFFATAAFATEGVQLHLFDRTTRGSDVLVDLAGAALAALAVEALSRASGRRTRTTRPRHPRDGRDPARTDDV